MLVVCNQMKYHLFQCKHLCGEQQQDIRCVYNGTQRRGINQSDIDSVSLCSNVGILVQGTRGSKIQTSYSSQRSNYFVTICLHRKCSSHVFQSFISWNTYASNLDWFAFYPYYTHVTTIQSKFNILGLFSSVLNYSDYVLSSEHC